MTPPSRYIGPILAGWLVSLLAAAPGVSLAADAEAELSYGEKPFSYSNVGISLESQATPFAGEPPLSGKAKAFRGKLNLGGTNTIALIWARADGKLYLDLNGDLNLTNDVAGVYSSQNQQTGNYQYFSNVRIPLPDAAGARQVVGDLNIYSYGTQPSGSFAFRSLWQGKLTLQSQDWEVGLLPDSLRNFVPADGGKLLLRPWGKRDQAFNAHDGSLQTVPFAKKLFLNGQAYQVTLAKSSGDGSRRLQFTKEQPALGDAKITGKFIQRLTLAGGPYQVVLDAPEAAVKLPVGTYSESQVWLQVGEQSARQAANQGRGDQRIVISEKSPAVLNVGGPLTNSVAVTRRGPSLNLSYQLLGAGGCTYTSANVDRSKPPEFVAFSGGSKVGSGKFEFG